MVDVYQSTADRKEGISDMNTMVKDLPFQVDSERQSKESPSLFEQKGGEAGRRGEE